MPADPGTGWFILSLVSAFAGATADALTKRYYSDLSSYGMGLVRLVYALPFLGLSLPFITVPPLGPLYYASMAAALPLEALALFCYMKALKTSPLSLCLPFSAFTPVFIIVTGRFFLGETIGPAGFMGIFTTTAGAYILNISQMGGGRFEPFKAIFREPGPRFMLLTALLYSLTATLGKLGIRHSSPSFFAVSYFTTFTVLMLATIPLVGENRHPRLFQRPGAGLAVGFAMAAMIFSHVAAISLIEAAYMISIKRCSLLFGVLYGAVWFREEKIGERLAGALVMIAGAFIIGFFH